jgi:2-polyprenyl-3-methyl-5-hydroxy-6-metoxy-1,4-benzoquinol methylase
VEELAKDMGKTPDSADQTLMPDRRVLDYSARCYASYWSTHMSSFKSMSVSTLDYEMVFLRRSVTPFLPVSKDAEILDIGCGHGALVRCMSQMGYKRVTGVDCSREMVSKAQAFGIGSVEIGDFLEILRDNPSRYQLITAFDVVEHQKKQDVLPLLDAIYRALGPGGTILIQTPNAMSHYGLWCRYGDFTHEVIFDAFSVKQVLAVAGFSNLRVMAIPPCARGLLSTVRRILWAIREPWLKVSFALEAGWTRGQVFTPNLLAAGYKSSA